MKKISGIFGTMALAIGSITSTFSWAEQSLKAADINSLLPAKALILSQTIYDLRQTGKEDNLVYYCCGNTWGMEVISWEKTILFKYENKNVDHLFFQGRQFPGVVFLDPGMKKPFIVFNNYSDAIHSEYHAFQWLGGSFQEVEHPVLGNNPLVEMVDGQSVVVTDNFGYGIPSLYQYHQGKMEQVNAEFPCFFDAYVRAAWKALEDPVLGILPGALEARADYLPAFLYAGKEAEGVRFADRLLRSAPSELTRGLMSRVHTYKGNLLLAMGREEEALGEYQLSDRLEHGVDNGAGAYMKMASFLEERGDLRRAALSYEKALDRMGQKDKAQTRMLKEKVGVLLDKMDTKGVEVSQGTQIDLGHPLTVTNSHIGGVQ
jgi:hypothetical protein